MDCTARRAIRILALVPMLVASVAMADDVPACDATLPTGSARESFRFTPLMYVADVLEKQGEQHFHLRYEPPATECLAERFEVGAATVEMHHATGPKDPAGLAWRLLVTRPEGRTEILVIGDLAGVLLNDLKPFFHVSEERGGIISWYALYEAEPSVATLHALATHIVEGSAKPLFAVTWEPGKKEGTIVAFDSKRLHK